MARDLSRLKELVKVVLPAVPYSGFNLRKWRDHRRTECNTVYCACGWAAMHPPFQEAGLRLIEEEDAAELVYETEEVEEYGYDAAAAFFNINTEEAYFFFDSSKYENGSAATKQQVIDRIEQYLKKN